MFRPTLSLMFVMALAACKGSDTGSGPAGKDTTEAPAATAVSLTGAGATFPYPLYTKWISEFSKSNPNVRLNYQSIGSGGGIRQITERTVDFGASDAAMTDEQLQKTPGLMHIPTCLGSVALAYNVEGIDSGLKLGRDVVAGIFLGTIKKWNDPAIASKNPGVALPDKPISSVHRSDGSGTTKIFVDYLSAISESWKSGPGTGTSVKWPDGLGGKGNEGVSALVSSTPGSIGYVELAYATQNKLKTAAVENASGAFVTPSLEATSAAAKGIALPEDFRVVIVNSPEPSSYPIAGFTYVLVYKDQTDAKRGKALLEFLSWALSSTGQGFTAGLHYGALPEGVRTRALQALGGVRGPDQKPLLVVPATP